MKKTLITIGILAIFLSMPALIAMQSIEKTNNVPKAEKVLMEPIDPDYDGTFLGGLGRVYKDENGEWAYDTYAYIAGVYKDARLKRVFGKIYNLDQEEIGSFWFINGRKILIGRIIGPDGGKAPIVGFLFYNEQYFIGRIMSIVGPAPNIWGEYTPN